MKHALTLLILISANLLWAQLSFADPDQLFFPVEKSQIRILPQRFEYQLIDANRFQVGNLLIQATDIGIRISNNKNQKFTFFWPLELLDFGDIVIKDSSGKAIWRRSVSKAQVQVRSSSSGTKLATTELSAADGEDLFRLIQRSPFFRFCALRENPQTKIFFCSKDLYLVRKGSLIGLQARDSLRPDSFVEINGKLVERQGFIFLNSSKDPLSLRALMLSGSTIEIDTRMKDVNFQDVVLSNDEKSLIVSAKNKELPGTQLDETSVAWKSTLDVERPSLYLKGEGNIPLKQEFLIEGPIRKESIKVDISGPAPEVTSSSSITLNLKSDSFLKLESAGDRQSSLQRTGNDTYQWTLKNLRRNETNRRYLKTIDSRKNPSEVFWAAYDIKRNSAFEVSMRAYYPLRADLQVLWFPNSRWQFGGRYDSQIGKNSKFDSSSVVSAEVFYRLSPGIHMIDPSYRAGVFYDAFSSSGGNLGLYGLSLGGQYKNTSIYGFVAPWLLVDAKAPLASTDSSFQVTGSFDIQAVLRFPENLDRYQEVGIKYRSYNFKKSSADINLSEPYLFYGYGILF